MINFALAKGRLAEESAEILARAGVDVSVLKGNTRKLVLKSADGAYGFFLVKPYDVPVYVEAGVADMGIAGKDTLLEQGRNLYEMLDLRIGACRLCIAGDPKKKDILKSPRLRVATKYVNTAKRVFAFRGGETEIIPLSGSIELAPLTGLADVIFDIVQSGSTLKANGLAVLEEVYPDITVRLAVNKVSLKTNPDVLPLVGRIKEILQ